MLSLVTYNTLIDGYCKVGELEGAFSLRAKMKAEPCYIQFIA